MNNKRKGQTAHGHMEQKAKQQYSASEITSQYDTVRLNPKGSCRADGRRGNATILKVCTYNGRTLQTEDDLDNLTDNVDQIHAATLRCTLLIKLAILPYHSVLASGQPVPAEIL